MAEKENKQKHKSTIDKYFSRTADGYKAWAEEAEEERCYLQAAIEPTGDADEDGNQGFDFHIAYHGKTAYLADGELLKQCEGINSFARSLLQQLENSFLINKNTDNETDNQI